MTLGDRLWLWKLRLIHGARQVRYWILGTPSLDDLRERKAAGKNIDLDLLARLEREESGLVDYLREFDPDGSRPPDVTITDCDD